MYKTWYFINRYIIKIFGKSPWVSAQDLAHWYNEDCETEDCQECCGEFYGHDHDPDEGFMCLNCGHEGFEDAMCDAYDRWKDSRYDD